MGHHTKKHRKRTTRRRTTRRRNTHKGNYTRKRNTHNRNTKRRVTRKPTPIRGYGNRIYLKHGGAGSPKNKSKSTVDEEFEKWDLSFDIMGEREPLEFRVTPPPVPSQRPSGISRFPQYQPRSRSRRPQPTPPTEKGRFVEATIIGIYEDQTHEECRISLDVYENAAFLKIEAKHHRPAAVSQLHHRERWIDSGHNIPLGYWTNTVISPYFGVFDPRNNLSNFVKGFTVIWSETEMGGQQVRKDTFFYFKDESFEEFEGKITGAWDQMLAIGSRYRGPEAHPHNLDYQIFS